MDICLQVLKKSNKSRFDSYSVRNSVLNISHITYGDCRMHFFSDNLSRNSCIPFCILTDKIDNKTLKIVPLLQSAQYGKCMHKPLFKLFLCTPNLSHCTHQHHA